MNARLLCRLHWLSAVFGLGVAVLLLDLLERAGAPLAGPTGGWTSNFSVEKSLLFIGALAAAHWHPHGRVFYNFSGVFYAFVGSELNRLIFALLLAVSLYAGQVSTSTLLNVQQRPLAAVLFEGAIFVAFIWLYMRPPLKMREMRAKMMAGQRGSLS